MIACLPQDITLTVVQDWLENNVLMLSKLDVAISNHAMRLEWLQLISLVIIEKAVLKKPIVCFLGWLNERQVHIKTIVADRRMLMELEGVTVESCSLAVAAVELDCSMSLSSLGVTKFLSYFPGLTSLSAQNCDLTDLHLQELLALPCQLRQLQLGGISMISSAAAVKLFAQHSATLTTIDCDVLDHLALAQLSQCCKSLIILSLICNHIADGDALVQLCKSNPNLTYLDLQGCQQCSVDNAVLRSIAQVCPKLSMLCLDLNDAITAAVIPDLLHCNALSAIRILGLMMKFFETGPKRYCDITLLEAGNRGVSAQQLCDVLANLNVSIRGFGKTIMPIAVNDAAISCLLDKNAGQLEMLCLSVDFVENTRDLQELICRCPNLDCLTVTSTLACNRIADKDLLDIARSCPKLIT